MCRPVSPARQQTKAPVHAYANASNNNNNNNNKLATFFRIGRMKFGYHGSFGILAVATTWWALQQETLLAVLVSCFFSSMVSHQATKMMHLVPADTKIYKDIIVAPHVDAFTMTVYLVYYINVRCLRSFLPDYHSDDDSNGYYSITFAIHLLYKGLLLLAYRPFVSKKLSDWNLRNLNTWIFGLPRLVGVTCDVTKAFLGESTILTHDLLFVVQSLLLASFAYSVSFRLRGSPHKMRYHVVSRIVYVAITAMLAYLLASVVYPDLVDSLSSLKAMVYS